MNERMCVPSYLSKGFLAFFTAALFGTLVLMLELFLLRESFQVNTYSIFVHKGRVVRHTVTNHYAGCQKQFKAARWRSLSITKVRNTIQKV